MSKISNVLTMIEMLQSGRKYSISELANELVDMIHYIVAIASLNGIDLNDAIIEKDKKTAIKYKHDKNLIEFLSNKN